MTDKEPPDDLLPELDDEPDEWVDSEDILQEATEEEIAEGNRQGQEINVDDDEDNGLEADPDDLLESE